MKLTFTLGEIFLEKGDKYFFSLVYYLIFYNLFYFIISLTSQPDTEINLNKLTVNPNKITINIWPLKYCFAPQISHSISGIQLD